MFLDSPQLAKKQKVMGGCFRDCKPSECANIQSELKEVEGKEVADLIIGDCKLVEDTLDNDTQYLGALTRSKNTSKEIVDKCKEKSVILFRQTRWKTRYID